MRPRVMIIDDDADTRDALEQLLELEGFTAQTAGDGAEALRLLEQDQKPCLILLDLLMPGVDGWQFMDELHRRGLVGLAPVIVLSGKSSPRPAPPGAAAVLDKPYGVDRLLQIVRLHCGSRLAAAS